MAPASDTKPLGLTDAEVLESRRLHGENRLTGLPPTPLWRRFLLGLLDPMILILLGALCIQIVLFLLGQVGWYESVGVLAAILIADGVSSVSEHRQQRRSAALKEDAEARRQAKVWRNGRLLELPVAELVVGDCVSLQAGDSVHADGVLFKGRIQVDQAVLNGESAEAPKSEAPEGTPLDTRDLLNPHSVYSGTTVTDGEAIFRVAVVGDRTLFGQLALEAQSETRQTPLQFKLAVLARDITRFGYSGALAIMAAIMAKTLLTGDAPETAWAWTRLFIETLAVAVTIVVCAVPEGLPMLTSLLLSIQSLRMVKDNVLVRKINGLETAGSLNLLFSDKTGTITYGRLSVSRFRTVDADVSRFSELSPALREALLRGIGMNNSATAGGERIIGGNSTDRALLQCLMDAGTGEIDKSCVVESHAFNSTVKQSSCRISENGRFVTYVKGAPEFILGKCRAYLSADGRECPLTDLSPLERHIGEQARRCMRLLAVARDGEAGLCFIALVSIRDDVRPEAVEAIREVRNAGIQVVMVTGDRRETAVAIAEEAGLLTAESDRVLTSAELAALSDDALAAALPDLRVVARALPGDKSRLVRLAQQHGMVTGMTGDGVNDAPALKTADVGFAMGSGTDVAKEAGDIVILDDNFASIRKAILYGRTIFKSIRKFLVFQLTVNVAAVLVCFLGPLFGTERVVLTVVQLLMVNLVMDTLAAIAFGGEPTLDCYMREKPVPRNESIVTRRMNRDIIAGAVCVTLPCLGILLLQPVSALFSSQTPLHLKSALFAAFMMAITFNGFTVRNPGGGNPFRGLGLNPGFIWIMLLILAGQFLFVSLAGTAFGVEPLTLRDWLLCATFALLAPAVKRMLLKATSGFRKGSVRAGDTPTNQRSGVS